MSEAGSHRLPRTVFPRRYDLRMEPDLETLTFRGRARIEVEITEPVSAMVLNVVDLDIADITLSRGDDSLGVLGIDYDTDAQQASIRLAREVRPGAACLTLEFTGVLNDQLHGFYRSTFTDIDGRSQVIATTQFEATDARRAFPCWDEPDFKAVFGITLVVPDHLMAISNGPELRRAEVDGKKVAITFRDTIPISTYLVAFVIGDFEATPPVDADGVAVRIVAPRGKLNLTGYALECAVYCLRYFRSYYGIPYPGEKIDHVAVPDFAFGAMENLGCIIYRETALLTDPETATTAELTRILDVVAHELAHMWFGDLVTMKWWNGIWLNEAFASFMEMKAAEAMRPEWKRWLSFAGWDRPWAYGVDSLASTRPVEFEVNSPAEANEMFDALTYGKGSAVLRMIEQYLGEKTFREGVGNYLRTHAYGNTETADLWASLDEASGEPVGEIMDSWILQGGFPLVEVRETAEGVELSQRRHLKVPAEDPTRWRIPAQLRGETGTGPFHATSLLTTPTTSHPLDSRPAWINANAGGHGFYRVGYQGRLLEELLQRLPELDDLERFCLVDDAWALVESGESPAVSYLEVAAAYRAEKEFAIWSAVLGGLGTMHHHLVGERHRESFGKLVMELIEPRLSRLGWEPRPGESDLTRQLRGLLLGSAGRLADQPDYLSGSRERFEEWLADHRVIDPEVAEASLFTVAAHGDDGVYERLFSLYQNTEAPQEKVRFLRALTFVETESGVDSTLRAVLDGTVRNQDSAWVLGWLFRRRRIGSYAWGRVEEQWDDIVASLPPMMVRYLVDGVYNLSDPSVADRVRTFLSTANLPHAEKAGAQALERLGAYVRLRERETEPLGHHLGSL